MSERSLSVIVAEGGPRGARLRQLAGAWAASGLLGESVWVDPADVVERPAGPPQVTATMVSGSGERRDDLFRVVGVRRLERLRLVVVHLLPHGAEVDAAVVAQGTRLAELFPSVLPRDVSQADGMGTFLQRVNLLVPESGMTSIPTPLLQPGWEVNAVVSAEDRPDLDRASIFVRDHGNLDGHAMAAVAAVAALWVGVDRGCLDDHDADSTSTERDLVVLRPSVRAVVGDDLVRKLANAAITGVLAEPAGPARLLPWARPASDPGGTARRAANELAALGDWAPVAPRNEGGPVQDEWAAKDALEDALRFNLRMYGVAAGWMVGVGRRAVEHVATGLIVGHGGDYVIRLEPRSADQIVRRAEGRLQLQASDLQHDMLVREASTVSPPTPSTWPSLRSGCFALADGSDLPAGMHTPEMAGIRELLPPAAVAPNPADVFHTHDGQRLRACDVDAAGRHRATLTARLAQLGGAVEPDGRQASPGVEEGADVAAAASPEAEALREEVVSLDRWVGRRDGTVLWELDKDVIERAHAAHRRAGVAFKEATGGMPPAAEALKRAQRRLMQCWKLLGALFALAVFALVWLSREGTITGSELARSSAGLTVALLLSLGLANHAYYKAVRRYERSVRDVLARRRTSAGDYVAAKREASRLDLLGIALLDWAEIIGWVLHRPWRPEPIAPRAISEEALTGLPASVGVAVPTESTADLPTKHVIAAIGALCNRGWSSAAFDEVAGLQEDGAGDAEQSGYLAADVDVLDSPESPRRQLLDLLAGGTAQRALTEVARSAVHHAVTAGAIELPPRIVQRLGHFGDGMHVRDASFFGGTLTPSIPFVDDAWTPTGMQRRRHLPELSLAWVPGGTGQTSGTCVVGDAHGDVAVRVDVSGTCEPSDLSYFQPTPSHVPSRSGVDLVGSSDGDY